MKIKINHLVKRGSSGKLKKKKLKKALRRMNKGNSIHR